MLQQAKRYIPKPVLNSLRKIKLRYLKSKSAEDVFTDIYLTGKWGKGDSPFFSGEGSVTDTYLEYVKFMQDFIRSHEIKRVVDLGCGDFRVGRHLTEGVHYTGCDVVQPLVEYNQKNFGNDHIQFLKRNIITDELPDGELCLIRQVFQHLSNESILKVLPKLKKYKYVIITDAQPNADKAKVNHDIPNFSGTRAVVHGTGLWLENSPFHLPVTVLHSYPLKTDDDEYLRLVLYKPEASGQ
jgi:SAM-dependent methyltransferase